MKNPKQFLLEKILGYKTNGHENLGQLHARHVDSISELIQEFAEDTAIEVITRLGKGDPVQIRDEVYEIKKARSVKVQSPKLF